MRLKILAAAYGIAPAVPSGDVPLSEMSYVKT
jgi:hypothetical protein